MRGSLILPWALLMRLGIIPAHAGLTAREHERLHQERDHPRACGAHEFVMPCVFVVVGSSPRMRGSLPIEYGGALALGIIPAHAGLTHGYNRRCGTLWDHPRACGAHIDS